MRLIRTALWLAAFATAEPGHARWSTDPAQPLLLGDRADEQVQPKLVATPDGGFYVSWFDNAEGGYDVYLQRVDAAGVPQWAANGIRVADRGYTSTEDYGLSIDDAGHALLAFRFPHGGINQALAVRVAPDGSLPWGPGVFASAAAGGVNAPRIVGTRDGHSVVAWSSGGDLGLQKLDADGTPLWGSGITLPSPTGNYLLADLVAADAGHVMLSWQAQLGASDRRLWTQKLAAVDGAPLWDPAHVQVMDASAGALQFGYFPRFAHDGAGGAVFAWSHVSGVAGRVRVQRVLANGSFAYPANGVPVSGDASRNRYAPAAAFDPASGAITVAWRETNAAQSQVGLYAQRVNANGSLAWGSTGLEVLPLSGTDKHQLQVLPAPGGTVIAWAEGTSPQPMPIRAIRLDTGGTAVWSPAMRSIKTAATDGSRLVGATSTEGFLAFAWQERPGSLAGDIAAQDLSYAGGLGERLFTDGFE